jgi:type IV secretory pathway TrbD component
MAGVLPAPGAALATADVAARNAAAQGRALAQEPVGIPASLLPPLAAGALAAAAGLALAAWRRAAATGLAITVVATAVFLIVSGKGLEGFARVRSAAIIEDALHRRLAPGDLVVHEGPLENSASLLLGLPGPVPLVDGLQSNLAFGATFPDAQPLIWDRAQLAEAWRTRTVFLVSVVEPGASVARALAPATLVASGAGRWLYTNSGDR